MPAPPRISIAFEAAGPIARVGLGVGDDWRASRQVPRTRQRNLELVPTLDTLLRDHGYGPADLHTVYVSLGPGSFTGLRMAIATAQMLALANPTLKLVGVPTLAVLAAQNKDAAESVAVCLNIKRGTMYTGLYQHGAPIAEPALRSMEQLLTLVPDLDKLAIVSEVDLDHPAQLPPAAATLDPEQTWAVGRALDREQRYTAPPALLPRYIREPEAVTLWEQQGKA